MNIEDLIKVEIAKGSEGGKEIKAWYPSGLGSCLTSRYLERIKVPPESPFEDRVLRVFSVGKTFEDWLVKLIGAQIPIETQVPFKWDEWNVSGKADLLIKDPPPMLYEFKTIHSKSFWYMNKQKEQGHRHHRQQLWIGLKCLNIEEGRLVYLSKDDLAIAEFQVFQTDKELEAITMDELMMLTYAWKVGLPPPPLVWEEGKWRKETEKDWQYTRSRWKSQVFTQPKYADVRTLELNYPLAI